MATPPQDQAARYFLERKKIGATVRDITKLDGHDCWYYVFDLDDGSTLELEVEWADGEWSTRVTAFLDA